MVDFKRFSIYVANRKVRKGWDYIILPDGKRVSVEPGKYLKLLSEKPLKFGFEDLTEEIGEKPDWDFDEPICEVVEETGIVSKKVRLKCTYGAGYENHLYFDNVLIYKFTPGGYTVEISFTYTDWKPVIMGVVGGVAATAAIITAAIYARRRRA
ncbi:MAG: hypothetical protein QXT64_00165 [Desulfurococcaceae archaeon]